MSSTRYAKDPNVVSRVVGGELVLVPVRSRVGELDSVFTLTDVGRHIWTLLDEPRSLEDLTAALEVEYDAAPTVLQTDAREFLGALEEAGLVTQVQP